MSCFRLLGGIIFVGLLTIAVWLHYADPSTIPLSVIAGLFGVALGFGLVTCKEIYNRKREFRANLMAVKAEFEYCGKTACTFLADDKKLPLYRLPTLFFEKAFPSLLSEGLSLEAEMYAVIEYFAGVETLNRGLDQANAVLGSADESEKNPRLDEEHSRNRLKAKRLVPSGEYYSPVAQALNRLAKPGSRFKLC